MDKLCDVASERAVLSGIFQYGEDGYGDVQDILQVDTFTNPIHQAFYRACTYLFNDLKLTNIDQSSLFSAFNHLKLEWVINEKENQLHLRSIMNGKILLENLRKWAAQIRKLQITRMLCNQLDIANAELQDIRGSEPIEQILGIAENAVFDFTSLLSSSERREPQLLGDGIHAYLDQIEANPCEIIGISSGMGHYDKAIGGGFRRKTVSLIGARQKALRYGSKVYTQNGPINIEDIVIGDSILHPFYGLTKVTAIYDHPNTQIYKVLFKDGDTVECCGDHLWEVYKRYPYGELSTKKPDNKTTSELIDDLRIGNQQEYKWDVRLPQPVVFNEQNVELDPYILGLLLGDGSFRNAITYSTADEELINYIKKELPSYDIKLEIDKEPPNCSTYRINGLQPIIRKLGLYKKKAHYKFIPKYYIYNSIEVRLAILQGLMDTDGCCYKEDSENVSSRARFATVSYQLAYDVKEIVQSLGGLCSIVPSYAKYKGTLRKYYSCEVRLPEQFCPFRLERKVKKHTQRKLGELKRTIINIEKLNIVDNARCITVEHNDGLFMTDNYVVTHNTGKSMLAANVALHVSKNLNIPVLYLDTEMVKEDHWSRALPNLAYDFGARVTITEVETGKYAKNSVDRDKIRKAADNLVKCPFYYLNISGMPFEEILSLARRWTNKVVGLDEDGRRKDCLIIYDYLKMMNADGVTATMQEYQALGFMTSAMHNFAVHHDVPILTFSQLNKDGIDRESTDVISGSDRILWLVTNFSIYKAKSDVEVANDGPECGTRKLIPISSRHGESMEFGDYINVHFDGKYGRIREGETRNNIKANNSDKPKDSLVPNNMEEQDILSSSNQ